MVTSVGLREISAYAQGVAPSRDRLVCAERCEVQRDAAEMIYRSHVAGLTVYSWPVCPENASPALGLQGSFADIRGAESSARLVLDLGVDGVITDIPDVAVRVRDERDASLVA
jgi:glycerophosphoryl diester phosphodiesterase